MSATNTSIDLTYNRSPRFIVHVYPSIYKHFRKTEPQVSGATLNTDSYGNLDPFIRIMLVIFGPHARYQS